MAVPDTLDMPVTAPEDVKHVEGFISMPFNEVETMVKQLGFAMSAEDLAFCQKYFAETEHRDPTMTELRAIDTYWSDHCRHTTFLSAIDGVEIQHPGNSPAVRIALRNMAMEYGLIVTGGTDYHGMNSDRICPVGSCTTADAQLERLLELMQKKHR